jgi:polar amino acid transport system substrate-binding protein
LDYTFLVPAKSSIQRIADVDRPGVRIAVVSDHASTLTLSRILKHAQLVYAATPDPTFELLRSGQADAFASVRGVLLSYSAKLPGSRVLDEHYGANLLGMVVPKDQAARLAYISEFIEQAKASGFDRARRLARIRWMNHDDMRHAHNAGIGVVSRMKLKLSRS